MSSSDISHPEDSAAPGTTHLTERQAHIFRFVCDAIQVRGYAPSMKEIGDAVGLSSCSSVAAQLGKLEAKGLIARDPRRSRAYRVLPQLPSVPPPPAADDNEKDTAPAVLKVMLTADMQQALTSGATLAVKRLLLPDTNCFTSGDADVLGQVIAISHPVIGAPE